MCKFLFAAWLVFGSVAMAQTPAEAPASSPAPKQEAADTTGDGSAEEPEATGTPAAEQTRGAGQNLLGQTDTARGEGRRNENVQITLVDNNAARESSQRLGPTATIIDEFRVERGYFSAEYGNATRGPIHAQPQRGAGIHGNVFWNHNNSIFSARSFFQVGSVQPARQNQFGAGLNTGLWKGAFFSFNGTEDINRGVVNGNALILLPNERTALVTDPAARKIVQGWIDAYPNVAPNRPDITSHALNTNSPQSVDTTFTNGQLNQKIDDRNTLVARYGYTAQRVDAFQFVTGQNPDTRNKSHTARLTWDRIWSEKTSGDFSIGFDRQAVLLVPGPGAVGPLYINGLTNLGPANNIPIDRRINQFRGSGSLQALRGRHTWTLGGSINRVQYNGDEQDGARPVWTIRDDFGNSAIDNLRLGKPYQLGVAFGDSYRGYRNWELLGFAGDHWTVNDRLTLNYGIRWEPVTKPSEIRNRSSLAYASDWNNVAGNGGFAYRLGHNTGVFRAAYGVMFGQIFPATYGQDRWNKPYYQRLTLDAPDLTNPFAGLTPAQLDPARDAHGMWLDTSPALATPYSYQYNASWEKELHAGWKVQVGYVGSRSHKLFQTWVLNRAQFVEGIAFTSATIGLRRPDQTTAEHFYTGNFSRAYYDAGRMSLIIPRWKGLTLNTSYWWSKAIDLGGDYVTTGAGTERFNIGGQNETNVQNDMKGLSGFDQPHAFMLQASWDTGRSHRGILSWATRNWNVSGVYLLKSGTPFTVTSGSDAPGFGNSDGVNIDRPVVVDPSVLGRTIGDPGTSRQLLPKSAFRFFSAPAEMSGNLGRNTFRKGRIANLNASLARTWTMPNDFQVTFRAESINLTNTAQFADPGSTLASPNFGQITNTLNDGRTFRFLLRLSF
ncbi:MAG: TonB-dependent receptor [Bryobacteraceae bacterium]